MKDLDKPKEEVIRNLLVFIKLEQDARNIADMQALRFMIVNDSMRIVSYDQAFLWEKNLLGRLSVTAVTGVSQLEASSPFFQSFRKLVAAVAKSEKGDSVTSLSPDDFPEKLQCQWEEVGHSSVLWCPLKNSNNELLGGIWLNRSIAWEEQEVSLMNFLADSYSHAILGLEGRGRQKNKKGWHSFKKFMKKAFLAILFVAVVFALFLPVRQSVIAPGEVVPIKPMTISPPIDGVIRKMHVQPNQRVRKGQPLFQLEDRVIRNDYDVAVKALEVARVDYANVVNKSFSNAKSKGEVTLLKAIMEQKEAEMTYSRDLLARLVVKAPKSGIAVFSDPNDWIGKPVSVGERIISLSNPARTEVQVWLPVDDAISLREGAKVKAFLSTDPTAPLDAILRQTSYEAQLSPEDVLAFKLKASFKKRQSPRIGLKLMAKIYGEEVTLFYYLFRKPIAKVRQYFGW